MNKKLIIILAPIIVLLLVIGITIYALTSDDEAECPNTDTIKSSCNSDGNLIRQEHYNADGELWWYKKYEYDADGNVIKREYYNADGSLFKYVKSEYDADGNVIKQEHYNADRELVHTYTYPTN
ncbi:MAG: hypothetical protein OXF85_03155 [Candidatus Saccharibacteria bacterium]|nr:hypothetical protein [Candidatus Saccharibacteria bacterium]